MNLLPYLKKPSVVMPHSSTMIADQIAIASGVLRSVLGPRKSGISSPTILPSPVASSYLRLAVRLVLLDCAAVAADGQVAGAGERDDMQVEGADLVSSKIVPST